MADFRLAFDTGVTFEAWADPPESSPRELPSRLNPNTEHPHTRAVGTTGTAVGFFAIVDGVAAPLDTALGGELFSAIVVEAPGAPPACTGLAGQSSVQRFTPAQAGHYTLFMTRQGAHGGIYAHVDVRD